ncbi:MAG: hypothetical protein A3K18_14880 [Lentisphaerae bacterium RIFOXYA12_64_32]|nr:MAG: hypothetical protein A3K18_14880 [Lentisphaerae bacterium RIFOXYA12_64_32]
MNSRWWKVGVGLLALVLAGYGSRTVSGEVATEGAVPGEWTMDLDAAQKLGAEEKLPMFLCFTGSDWCGWCKLMDKSVFSQPEWQEYTKENLVLVWIDFPKDASLVPEKYVARNQELQKKFGVEGYPTYVVLDDNGATELGRLRAARDKTAKSFIADLAALLRNREPEQAKFAAKLPAEKADAFRKLVADLKQTKSERQAAEQKLDACDKRIEDLQRQVDQAYREARAAELGPERGPQFLKLSADLAKANAEMETWLDTRPARNPENEAKIKAFREKIADLEKQLEAFAP